MNRSENSLNDFQEARDGDEDAMNRLLQTWRQRLYAASRYQLRQVHARADTSDVVQESLLQAWQDIPNFRAQSEGEFRSWVRKVAKGRLANTRRYHNADRRSVRAEVGPKPLFGCATNSTSSRERYSPELIEMLRVAIGELDERLQLIVKRRYFDHARFREIAEEVGCTPGGARTMCERAVQQLRRAIKNRNAGPRAESQRSSTDPSRQRLRDSR